MNCKDAKAQRDPDWRKATNVLHGCAKDGPRRKLEPKSVPIHLVRRACMAIRRENIFREVLQIEG
jgi:hypothetical protein